MEIKIENNLLFDVSKICRVCLSEKEQMRSVFMQDESTGQSMILAEMLMGFSAVQIENGDGLPTLICLQCVHQISRCYSFKQLCEQSDMNLRHYLGKPVTSKQTKLEENQNNDYTTSLFLDNFGMESSSEDSDEDDYKDDFLTLPPILSDNPNDEKVIAQKQLLKAAKFQKMRLTKRKLLTKGGKSAGKL
ncbi:unnamed protein product [Callosobruchus maculatus]|uniref:ZAD domain-containing protein n=1 Tax=Callosobruchus maculatus TaxID=64391 RepID=A0A653DN76_CALMS|nr:unnamed protein product [Callosobruchus maculatus]